MCRFMLVWEASTQSVLFMSTHHKIWEDSFSWTKNVVSQIVGKAFVVLKNHLDLYLLHVLL